MTFIHPETEQHNYSVAQDTIRKAVDELLDAGDVNPGLIAHLLVAAAMDLSYAACENSNLIFSNLLSSIVAKIPMEEIEQTKLPITHSIMQNLLN